LLQPALVVVVLLVYTNKLKKYAKILFSIKNLKENKSGLFKLDF